MIYIENAMKRVPSISNIHLLEKKNCDDTNSTIHTAGAWFVVFALALRRVDDFVRIIWVSDSRNDKPK